MEDSLLSFEKLDRASPDLWPEQLPGVAEFAASFKSPISSSPPKWMAQLENDDQEMLKGKTTCPSSSARGGSVCPLLLCQGWLCAPAPPLPGAALCARSSSARGGSVRPLLLCQGRLCAPAPPLPGVALRPLLLCQGWLCARSSSARGGSVCPLLLCQGRLCARSSSVRGGSVCPLLLYPPWAYTPATASVGVILVLAFT
uniref:Protein lin-52 homolog n=1 Tax=Leptobrachium leishanense TaxID=445787 RepID=A0A8C5Q1D9_9ANUR